ncbi:MAG: methyl-accepting chemotaxis protein [Desulfovibrionaceae bacterium]|nr:methyl-accepting chemotaxis protein [Desulfovibrionaceae bacterium]
MKFSISRKIMLISAGAVIVSSAVALYTTFFCFDRLLDRRMEGEIRSMQIVVSRLQEQDEQRVLQAAKMLTTMPQLITALQAGDAANARFIAAQSVQQLALDAVTVTDAKGIVVARGHSDRAGDDISNRSTMQAAISGIVKVGVLFEPNAVIPFSIRCDAPIYAPNKALIGVLSLAVSLGTEAHIDSMKRLTGLECALFSGNTCVMTTIKDANGKRAIGTTPEDSELTDRVLKKGEPVHRKFNFFGVPHTTIYWPAKDINGDIIGMWFIGESLFEWIEDKQQAVMIASACVAGVALALALLASMLGGKIALPIRRATDYAVQVADGKLDAPLAAAQSRDEVWLLVGALQRMVSTLKERISEAETISAQAKEQARQAHDAKVEAEAAGEEAKKNHEEILNAAERLDSAVKIISHTSVDLTECIRQAEDDAGKQAEYITASTSAMEEMSVTAEEVATNAANTKDFSIQTREKATQGEKIVEGVIDSINGLQKNSLALKDDMTELSTHAKSISQIMNVISDIADQTNLLALNAAIEAARAGEAGRGFAVVADEVRKLAEKTMASTGDVSQSVNAIYKSMDISMEQVSMTAANIEQATELATQSGAALQEIVTMADDMARQVEGIVTACEHQAEASERVNRSIVEINTIADATRTSMGAASRDIAELAVQTDGLVGLVAEMKRG